MKRTLFFLLLFLSPVVVFSQKKHSQLDEACMRTQDSLLKITTTMVDSVSEDFDRCLKDPDCSTEDCINLFIAGMGATHRLFDCFVSLNRTAKRLEKDAFFESSLTSEEIKNLKKQTILVQTSARSYQQTRGWTEYKKFLADYEQFTYFFFSYMEMF